MIKLYEKYVDQPLNSLDNGNLFKKGIYYYLMLIGAGLLLGGLFYIIAGFFGDNGYVKRLGHAETGMIVRSSIASIFTFAISIVTVIGVVLVFYKRSTDLNNKEYTGLLEYLYKEMFPTIIKIYGECLALFPVLFSLMSFFSVLFVARPYSPLSDTVYQMYRLVEMDFVFQMMSADISNIDGFGDYLKSFFMGGLGGILMGFIMSFSMLLSTYIAIEVYTYLVRIIINLVKFIPKFAIPLWIQKSDRNKKRASIDIRDI